MKIIILKFGAAGDVLRTTSILSGIKRQYPVSHITWVVEDPVSFDLLKGLKTVDNLLAYKPDLLSVFKDKFFDLLLSLEEEPEALNLAMAINATTKRGYGLDKEGKIAPFNKEAEYAFRLRIDDELKFYHNEKTYPEIIYQTCCLDYQKDEYAFVLPPDNGAQAQKILQQLGVGEHYVIGLNTGAGPRFAHKAWTVEGYCALIEQMTQQLNAKILLLGGEREKDKNDEILKRIGNLALDARTHGILTFAGIINGCHLVVTGDTLGMHIAIALKKKVVVLFGSTCEQEIELYGRGVKLYSTLRCAPCYKKECNRVYTCMDDISVQSVFDKILSLVPLEIKKK